MGLNGEIMAGPNSLTVTRDGFSNVHHVDRDASSWAFGIFWSGTTKEGKFTGEVCQVDEVLQGGEFWWAEYGVAVASAPDGQYAELAWRAMRDYHGTLACSLVDGGVWRDAKANRKVDDLGCRAPRRTRFRQRFRMGLGILKPGHAGRFLGVLCGVTGATRPGSRRSTSSSV
uniref:Tet-like 2OG-Fe(II) oxygenase domain-containing protein n=1 Tax=Tremella fuciformis TaxID=64657 RepID=D5KY06_9TREE|nr:unknown [Tremella fuciformis]